MKSFTKLAMAFLSGDRSGHYKRYHIEGDWLVSHQCGETYVLAYRQEPDSVWVICPHPSMQRAHRILVDLAGAKRGLHVRHGGERLLAGGYALANRDALPANKSAREMLLKAMTLDIGRFLEGGSPVLNVMTLRLLDSFCGKPMGEALEMYWRRHGWMAVLPESEIQKIKSLQGEDIDKRLRSFTPEDGVGAALRLLRLSNYAHLVKLRAKSYIYNVRQPQIFY